MRKSMYAVGLMLSRLFPAPEFLIHRACAQAPIYTSADYVKSATFRQSAVYQAKLSSNQDVHSLESPEVDSVIAGTSCDSAMDCFSQGCGAANCGSGGCACGNNQWSATASALFLFRHDPALNVLAFNPIRPNERLDASDFNFGMHTGFELALQSRLGCNALVELRYFGLDHWRSTFAGQTTPNELLQFNSAVPVFALSGTGVSADYGSKLHNSELNFGRYYGDSIRLLTGFRYLELDERGAANLQNAQVPFSYITDSRNRLYGGQLGAQGWLICRNGFSWDVVGKAGIYGNATAQNSTVSTGAATLNANGIGGRTAFIGEIGTNGAYCLTNNLSLRGGYRLLWVDGVALVSNQLASTDFFNGSGLNDTGNVFYHGATAGLEFAF